MYRVLFVDDDEAVCRMIRESSCWETAGFRVTATAENGKEALERLSQGSFQLLVTDIRMPVMDGMELIQNVQEHIPELPVVIVSNYDNFAYAREGMRLGVWDFVPKPLNEKKLLDMLDGVRRRLEAEQKRKWTEDRIGITGEQVGRLFLDLLQARKESVKEQFEGLCREDRGEPERPGGLSGTGKRPSEAARNWLLEQLWSELFHTYPWLEFYCGWKAEKAGRQRRQMQSGMEEKTAVIREELDQLFRITETFRLAYVDETVSRILHLMTRHIGSSDCLEQTARELELSRDYVRLLFKRQMNMGQNEYLTMLRMEYAKRLLGSTELKVYEVGLKAGYGTIDYFSRLFRIYTGMTPRSYRLSQKTVLYGKKKQI